MNDVQPIAVDVSALIDADWPEWQSALEDIRREYGDEGVRALLRRLQEYSITSYVELARDAERAEQGGAAADPAWLDTIFPETDVPSVGATDYVRAVPRMIASWINGPFTALGTDGFGKSERRSALRAHFKVDAASIADAARRLASS